jgi:hypothetical protein
MSYWNNWIIPDEIKNILSKSNQVIFPQNREEIIDLALGGGDNKQFEVGYAVDKLGYTVEANVVKCKNGLAINYIDPYMRRRDPDCLIVNNISKTDKISFSERLGYSFENLRNKTFAWLQSNELIVLPFMAGGQEYGYPALLIAPKNAAFFVASLYDLQMPLDIKSTSKDFQPKSIIYLAPPFRHTHFEGKQTVVHNNHNEIHEVFSYNLYPGPSAKKGIYGVLLSIGAKEGWITVHGSTVKVVTPYDNEIIFLHEGASGSGKSEMLEYAHRSRDGRLKLGENFITGDKKYLSLGQSCKLFPVTDDMALCHPKFQKEAGKLVVKDAENGWFIRVNHIQKYGTDATLENLTIHANQPLIFLNVQGQPDSTCLIWEHIEDEPGKLCPNPRVIIPRHCVRGVHDDPVEIDYRSFGLRTPPCSLEVPSYGIFGILHLLPPALAWLWRLVAPRGFSNPSIIDSGELESEGVGSYWPFATGRRVDHANLLLNQILNTPKTRYTLIPNQHIGVWQVGFMPQWIAREYLARRGQALFKSDKITPARSSLAGYTIKNMQFEGSIVADKFLEVNNQPEIGNEGYDKGAQILYNFFCQELRQFLVPELNPLGRKIIECCINKGSLEDYEQLIPSKY